MIEPKPSSYTDFPQSELTTDGMQTIEADFSRPVHRLHIGVEYAEKSGMPLHLHILEPRQPEGDQQKFPLILYVQGSAWFKQETGSNIAQLARFARRGFVIAVVEYRPSPVAPFPAQIEDSKTALRFMLSHADTYHVNPSNVIVWGDSSGGHTAVMTGLTAASRLLDDGSAQDESLVINAVVDFYGPSDITKMNEEPSIMDHRMPKTPEGMLIGGLHVLENREKAAVTNPLNYISPEQSIPPMLILHGDKDRLVPFGQSVMLYEALRDAGQTADFYRVRGADHGGPPFWTDEVLDIVETFIRTYL